MENVFNVFQNFDIKAAWMGRDRECILYTIFEFKNNFEIQCIRVNQRVYHILLTVLANDILDIITLLHWHIYKYF